MQKHEQEKQFEKHIRDNELLIYKVCRMYAYSQTNRQDLFQEIVIQLWKAFPKFKEQSNIEQKIFILETKLRQYIIGMNVALLLLIVLIEISSFFHNPTMLSRWLSLSPFIRFGAYTVLLLFQYFITRITIHREFEQHIAYLKELVKQMQ